MRHLLAVVPKDNAEMAAAAIRTILAQPDPASVRDQFDDIATKLDPMLPKVAEMMIDAKDGSRYVQQARTMSCRVRPDGQSVRSRWTLHVR